ncbi:MAG: histidine phosphatase family protein [Dehalococcoidia bacterium]
MTTDVLLVRHAQTHGNVNNLFCGHTETPLTALGTAQARALGRRLAPIRIDAAVSSDLSRAADTARHALDGRPVTVALDARLREMHYGDWEALEGKALGEQHPELMREFFQGKRPAPGGETIAQLRERTASAIRELVDLHRGGTVMVVSHGNAIQAMLAELLGLTIEATWTFAFDNASLTRLHFSQSGRLTVRSINDATHTEGLGELHA